MTLNYHVLKVILADRHFQVESTLDDYLSPLPGEVAAASTVAASTTASAAISAGLLFGLPTLVVPSKMV